MACIALIALAASAGRQLLIRLGATAAKLAPLIAVVLLLVCATLTWRQSGIYANPETLWRDTLRKNPGSWLAHNNLSRILLAQNKLDEAISHLTRSLGLLQTAQAVHPYNVADAHFNLALALRARGKYQDAIEHLRRVLDIRPNDREADYNLRNILELQGRLKEAGKPGP
jgi:tetratricopeptide (TPR) repeat protein